MNATPVHVVSGNLFIIFVINDKGGVSDSMKTPKKKNPKPESNLKH